ncbi:CBS domain-containing protein [Mahella sp.]|uniref:magnesium transporter n=1 Tax=Mahella sp. TaxID=2798721 RepID=UPI0025C68650|nr:CBS domain-containing protein [Mahella sp.]MBZ4666492.1 MgtE intracellular region [Mahella sp.]
MQDMFFSQLVGKPVFTQQGTYIGKLKDAIASIYKEPPIVTSIVISAGPKVILVLDADINAVKKDTIILNKIHHSPLPEDILYIAQDIMDKQIVDVNGRKVVRVNDLKATFISQKIVIIGVDIGFSGLLRRLGIERPIKFLCKLLHIPLGDNIIAWDNVEPIVSEERHLKLAVPYKKLRQLHPADIADIIEDLDSHYRSAVFHALDEQTLADTLEEIEPDVQVNIIENMSEEEASNILENMPADEVADILEELDEEHAQKLLERMDKEDSEEIKGLMEYEDKTVGSMMSTDFIAFPPDITAQQTIDQLRLIQPSPDEAYYLYVIDKDEHLIGVVSLRDLVVAPPDRLLKDIMDPNVIYVRDTDGIYDLTEVVTKYDLLAVPVVDDDMVLVGVAIINDIIDEVFLPRRRKHA